MSVDSLYDSGPWCSLQVCAEVKQAQAKLSQLEQTGAEQRAELERLQLRGRDLELELGRSNQRKQTSSSLQDELNDERARLVAADKKVRHKRTRSPGIQGLLKVPYCGETIFPLPLEL